jgi:hypothetical protein
MLSRAEIRHAITEWQVKLDLLNGTIVNEFDRENMRRFMEGRVAELREML